MSQGITTAPGVLPWKQSHFSHPGRTVTPWDCTAESIWFLLPSQCPGEEEGVGGDTLPGSLLGITAVARLLPVTRVQWLRATELTASAGIFKVAKRI